MTATILVVEDDPAIRAGVVDALEFWGYRVLQAGRGDEGLEMALRSRYDLLLLDLILPEVGGLEILRSVREADPAVPVIILTAKGDETDRVQGLRLGADDYVVKPFSVKELTARVEAVLRRSPERPRDLLTLELPCGRVDFRRSEVRYTTGERADLSEKELDVLRHLAGHAGRCISREELLSRVWRLDPRGLSTRAVDMQVVRLREKLRDDATNPRIIETVRGKGYRFRGEVVSEPAPAVGGE